MCDITRCATCSSFDTCIIPCDAVCETCNSDNVCLSCSPGYLREGTTCTPCADHC